MIILQMIIHFFFLTMTLLYGLPLINNWSKTKVITNKNLVFTCIGLAGLVSWYVHLMLF